jgi:hypothetical protein
VSDLTLDTSTKAKRIPLPDGDYLEPRAEFANDVLGVTDRTAQRMDLPTTYVGGVAYVPHRASLAVVAASVKRKNQPRSRAKGR